MTTRKKRNQSNLPNDKRVKNANEDASAATEVGNRSDQSSVSRQAISKNVKRCFSLAIVAYLAVVVLGPLSNPIGSEFLTRPLAKLVSPVHRILHLGHGYRFFGPDPGPSHLVVYRITGQQGELVEGHFPDRDRHSPRLVYHRWFMLSETVFNEHAMTPDNKSFRENDTELEAQIKKLRTHGKFAISQRIARERQKISERYEDTRQRIDDLVIAIARHLLKSNNGTQIEMFVQERSIPFSVQVLTGTKLDDPQYLSPLTKIGEFKMESDGAVYSLEDPPPQQTSPADSEGP